MIVMICAEFNRGRHDDIKVCTAIEIFLDFKSSDFLVRADFFWIFFVEIYINYAFSPSTLKHRIFTVEGENAHTDYP